MRCGGCEHFHRESDVEILGSTTPGLRANTLGRCRRGPPQLAVFFRKDDNEVVPMAAWPQLHESEKGCGEYGGPMKALNQTAHDVPLEELNLSHRARTRIVAKGVKTAKELSQHTAKELLKIDGFAGASLYHVRLALLEHGMALRGDPDREGGASIRRCGLARTMAWRLLEGGVKNLEQASTLSESDALRITRSRLTTRRLRDALVLHGLDFGMAYDAG